MKKAVDRYVLTFESEPVRNRQQRHQQKRHHWMICLAKSPDELVSWGHAPTHELAESEARKELKDLLSGLTQGRHVSQQHHAVPSARS
jgi:L-alanine-DL-glutamate epimerase-like enolase superfamily enzyme